MGASLMEYDSFDNFAKNKKTKGENRKDYYQYLVRPDGSPLSEKDCLLLDLCIQWTKGGKVCTSTYKWLLENKFPRHKSSKTVSRTFVNISLYIKAKFYNSQIINNTTKKDKIRIERVGDFDQKLLAKISKNSTRGVDKTVHPHGQNCPPPMDKTVHPSTYIEDNNLKITTKDYINTKTEYVVNNTSNQFHNSNLVSSNSENVKTLDTKIETKESIEKSEKLLAKGKSIGNLNSNLISKFPFGDNLILEAISKSEKPDFDLEEVKRILFDIINKSPTKKLYGGRQGLIKYIIKFINGEKNYKKDKAESIAQRIEKRKKLESERSNQPNKFQSIEEYYRYGK